MRYEISASIPYYDTTAVGCFDPTRVAVLLRDTISGVVVDPHDHAWERYEAFRTHSLDAASAAVANDARRYGPIYKFVIKLAGSEQEFKGQCNRYHVRVHSSEPFPASLKSKLLNFFESLKLDDIAVSSIRQDGNNREEC